MVLVGKHVAFVFAYGGLVVEIQPLKHFFGAFCQGMLGLNSFLLTHGCSAIKPLKVKLLAGEQKATKILHVYLS